jgi:hypothetical protein
MPTKSRHIYSQRQDTARGRMLTLRVTEEELQTLDDLAVRYSRAKGLERIAPKTVLIREGIEGLLKAFPKQAVALVIRLPALFGGKQQGARRAA